MRGDYGYGEGEVSAVTMIKIPPRKWKTAGWVRRSLQIINFPFTAIQFIFNPSLGFLSMMRWWWKNMYTIVTIERNKNCLRLFLTPVNMDKRWKLIVILLWLFPLISARQFLTLNSFYRMTNNFHFLFACSSDAFSYFQIVNQFFISGEAKHTRDIFGY